MRAKITEPFFHEGHWYFSEDLVSGKIADEAIRLGVASEIGLYETAAADPVEETGETIPLEEDPDA